MRASQHEKTHGSGGSPARREVCELTPRYLLLSLIMLYFRYCNMDYLFWKSLLDSDLEAYFVSYDIVCQWSVNLRARMATYDPTFVLFNGKVHVRYLVPKFHLPAHVPRCRTSFSWNYTEGGARTDGEAPERGWAEINPLATSTKEMGPGSRRDTLDAHFGDYNWRKTIGMGKFVAINF